MRDNFTSGLSDFIKRMLGEAVTMVFQRSDAGDKGAYGIFDSPVRESFLFYSFYHPYYIDQKALVTYAMGHEELCPDRCFTGEPDVLQYSAREQPVF